MPATAAGSSATIPAAENERKAVPEAARSDLTGEPDKKDHAAGQA